MKDLTTIPKRDWNKTLEHEEVYRGKTLRIYSVDPQAHLIGVTQPVNMLAGYSADAILVKAFEKNYKTPARPGVVEKYGFEQMHGEPLELVSFVYEFIFDRATEAEMNRYRHNSKNYESSRYVDMFKHGLTVVFPDDCVTPEQRQDFIQTDVLRDFRRYADAIADNSAKKQAARRRLGTYQAVESAFAINLRSLWHMARQRSSELSPNGREAEPQISDVMTQAVYAIKPFLPRFYDTLIAQIGKGYR